MINTKKFILIGVVFLTLTISCQSHRRIANAERCFAAGKTSEKVYDYRKSYRLYSKAIRLEPNEPLYYIARANVRYKQWEGKDYKLRIAQSEDYEKAISLSKNRANEDSLLLAVHSGRMIYHYDTDQPKLAIINANYLIAENHGDSTAYLYKCLAQLRLKDTATAYQTLDTLLSITSNDIIVLRAIAEVEYRIGLFQMSIYHYQICESQHALTHNDLLNMAQMFWINQRKDSACLYFSRVEQTRNYLGLVGDIQEYCTSAGGK